MLIAEYYFIEWRAYFGSVANIFSFHNRFFFGLLSDAYFPLPRFIFLFLIPGLIASHERMGPATPLS